MGGNRRRQEDVATKLRSSVHKEKERAALYKAQVSLLDDQLRAASEELDVFRQLDVYKATLQREFATVRHSRATPSSAIQNDDKGVNSKPSLGGDSKVLSPSMVGGAWLTVEELESGEADALR